MQQSLALLATHVLVVVAEHEAHGGEEVALAGTIAADDNVALGREGLDLGLVLVALEALDGDLFDVAHGGGAGAMCVSSGRAGGGHIAVGYGSRRRQGMLHGGRKCFGRLPAIAQSSGRRGRAPTRLGRGQACLVTSARPLQR